MQSSICWSILGIFSVENIDRLGDFMFQTSDNSQMCIDSQCSSQQLTIVRSLIYDSTQPILVFSGVRVLHLARLKEGTWLNSFGLRLSYLPSAKLCALQMFLHPKSFAMSKFQGNLPCPNSYYLVNFRNKTIKKYSNKYTITCANF